MPAGAPVFDQRLIAPLQQGGLGQLLKTGLSRYAADHVGQIDAPLGIDRYPRGAARNLRRVIGQCRRQRRRKLKSSRWESLGALGQKDRALASQFTAAIGFGQVLTIDRQFQGYGADGPIFETAVAEGRFAIAEGKRRRGGQLDRRLDTDERLDPILGHRRRLDVRRPRHDRHPVLQDHNALIGTADHRR